MLSDLPVVALPIPGSVVPGQPDPKHSGAVIEAIRKAVGFVTTGEAGALVTNPVHKKTLYDGGFPHPGHTEFLAELAGGVRSVMMLTCPGLRVIPVSGHVPLVVPLTLLRHHVRRQEIEYLAGQSYLAPHPKELMLRNHV